MIEKYLNNAEKIFEIWHYLSIFGQILIFVAPLHSVYWVSEQALIPAEMTITSDSCDQCFHIYGNFRFQRKCFDFNSLKSNVFLAFWAIFSSKVMSF